MTKPPTLRGKELLRASPLLLLAIFCQQVQSKTGPNKSAAENCSGRGWVSRWLLPPPPFRLHAASAPPSPALRSL